MLYQPHWQTYPLCDSQSGLGWPILPNGYLPLNLPLDGLRGAFLEAYAANRSNGDRSTVEGNPVGLAILKLIQDDGRWSGTMTELKTILRNRYPLLTDDPYSFPRQENKLSAAIRRIIPPLRRMGVEISFARQGQSGERAIRIEKAS